jgi:predicted PurR-regulated permease PerM
LFIIGVKYALLLSVPGAILNLISHPGIFVACILSALIAFSINTPSAVFWPVVSILAIYLIDASILLPKIVSSKSKLLRRPTLWESSSAKPSGHSGDVPGRAGHGHFKSDV